MRNATHRSHRLILSALFLFYLGVLLRITLLRGTGARTINVIPFHTIAEYLRFIKSGNKLIGASNLLGNLLLLFPLGYLAAALLPRMRRPAKILALSFVWSAAIEVLQYILACGAADVDDVILNTLGGVAGYAAYVVWAKIPPPGKRRILINVSLVAACIGLFSVSGYRLFANRPTPGELGAPAQTIAMDVPPGGERSAAATLTLDVGDDFMADPRHNADEDALLLILINKWNPIPKDCEVELAELESGQWVARLIHPDLLELLDAARRDGVSLAVVSGYRTAETQQRLLDAKIAAYSAEGYPVVQAVSRAEAWVAVPGTSEHQLGIAVDLGADGLRSTAEESYSWLEQNAHRFGFIHRYPPDKTAITGVISEPWHYRYVGAEAAADIQSQGVCLEEYLSRIH